jgi:hypothetical protein
MKNKMNNSLQFNLIKRSLALLISSEYFSKVFLSKNPHLNRRIKVTQVFYQVMLVEGHIPLNFMEQEDEDVKDAIVSLKMKLDKAQKGKGVVIFWSKSKIKKENEFKHTMPLNQIKKIPKINKKFVIFQLFIMEGKRAK